MPAPQIIVDKTFQPIHGLAREANLSTSKRLEGKIAIITGGARGIGEATVRLFSKHGAKVIVADIDDTLGEALVASLSPAATYVHCDVSIESDVENLVSSTVARYGRVDVFFNNAGILGSQTRKDKSILHLDSVEFDRVMSVNVKGTALGIKHASRAMISSCNGSIISTASVAGIMGGMGPHAYSASKHAIVGLTKNAACELGKYGIRVNCISPFGVATKMLVDAWRDDDDNDDDEDEASGRIEKMEEFVRGLGHLKRATLKAKDIAEAALFLASDESKYVSGHNLVVDGGITTSTNCVGL